SSSDVGRRRVVGSSAAGGRAPRGTKVLGIIVSLFQTHWMLQVGRARCVLGCFPSHDSPVPMPLVPPHHPSSKPRGSLPLSQTLLIPRATAQHPAPAVFRIRIPVAGPGASLPHAEHPALHNPAKYIRAVEKIASYGLARSILGSLSRSPQRRPQTPISHARCPPYPSAPVCPPLSLLPPVRPPAPAGCPGRESSSHRLRPHPGFAA